MSAGYSAAPLAKKLGLRAGLTAWFADMPATVRAEIAEGGHSAAECPEPVPGLDAAHIFCTERAVLAARLTRLRALLAADGFIWVSWPKKASGVVTDITEDVIRDVALPMGLVDIKVCAVDATWSGLKLVIRRALRAAHAPHAPA